MSQERKPKKEWEIDKAVNAENMPEEIGEWWFDKTLFPIDENLRKTLKIYYGNIKSSIFKGLIDKV